MILTGTGTELPSVMEELQDGRDAVCVVVWDSSLGEPSPPGSPYSQPKVKTHLARVGTASGPWQTPFVLFS